FGSIGSTVGTGLIGSIVTGAYLSNLTNSPLSQTLSGPTLELIQGPQNLLSPQVASSLPRSVIELAQQSLVNATHSGFLVCLGVAVIAFLGVLTVPDIRIKGATQQLRHSHAQPQAQAQVPSRTLESGESVPPPSLEGASEIVKLGGGGGLAVTTTRAER